MAELDLTAMFAALKEYHDESKLTDIVALQSSLLGLMPKGKFLGRGQPYPMITDPGQASLSGDYAEANTNRVGATYERFMMSNPGKIYAIGGIDRTLLAMAESPKGAFESAKADVGAKLAFVARELAHTAFRTENAVCGTVSTIAEGGGQTTIVVTDHADLANLGPGARLVASATAAGALRAATVYPVVSVNHSTGTIVLTGTAATTSSWAIGDSLHRAGSATAGAPTAIYPSGLGDWLPDDAPVAGVDSWRTVDRGTLPDKLAGIRVDATTSQVREAVSEMAARIIANGGSPDLLFVHPLRFSILEQELDTTATHEKIMARDVSAGTKIGYNFIRIAAGNGSVKIVSDPFAPFKRGYMLTMKTWRWHGVGGQAQPRMRGMDGGGNVQQMENADAVKFQCEAKGDMGCNNPGANGVIKFAA